MQLDDSEFRLLREYVHDLCGLALTDQQKYLVQQRLEPLAKQLGCVSFMQLHDRLRQGPAVLQEKVICAITTPETSFFRDEHPFAAYTEHVLPDLVERALERRSRLFVRRGPKVRIWCAASSTGQEPYSLAMLLHEWLQAHPDVEVTLEDFEILATDICAEVLAKAVAGIYNKVEVERGLSEDRRSRFMTCLEDQWRIDSELRRMVQFRQINIAKPFESLGSFDVIFCRNVLIYFNQDMRSQILKRFYELLTTDGYLFLGASENVHGASELFEIVKADQTQFFRARAIS